MKRRIIKIISLILCGAVLICSNATAQCTQNIDKSEKTSYTEYVYESGSSLSLNEIRSQSEDVPAVIISPFLIVFVRETPGFLGKIKTVFFVGLEVKIKSSTENFCKVESKNGTEGYVFKWWLDEKNDKEDDGTLKFNREFEHVYIDHTNVNESTGKPRTQLQPNYSGTVTYSSSNSDIISVDSKTGLITGKKAGTANLKATVDGETVSIPVYCIYKWKKGWTGKASKSTTVYSGPSNSTTALTTISSGIKFYVTGDDGSSAGWAYGYVNISNGTKWGFVKINDISTKGTVSQYNSMTTIKNDQKVPVVWPMYDETIKNISSPYAPRNVTSSGTIHHRGYDITTGTPGEIEGKYVVASFSGTVTKIHKNTSDCGFCLSISTDAIDPVTKKNISIIYMHLKEIPKYKNGINISLGDYITVGTIIGKVGNTNGNTDPSMGYHLHFEANSQNAAVGDSGRSDFTYTLNPMYFFVEKTVTFSNTNSYQKYGGYWYNY